MFENRFLLSRFPKIKNIHFIGVGGVSMSALADIMRIRGFTVSGSDQSESETTRQLCKNGIKIFIGHNESNVEGCDLIVYTAAVKQDNPELQNARRQNIPCLERAEFLGLVMRDYECPVGISGTHGKTTTTSMLSLACIAAGLDPTVMIGGTLCSIGGNYRLGKSGTLIFEACEYVDSFLNFFPKTAIILNIEADHLDYFSGIEQIKQSFLKFADLCGQDGLVIANFDDENVREIAAKTIANVATFGTCDDAKYIARNISLEGFPSFDFFASDSFVAHIKLSVPGFHNVQNALAALAFCMEMKLDISPAIKAISSFDGVCRRFQKKGEKNGVTIIDDYAHHPTEITATLKSAKQIGFKKVICIFQPHTYSRTRELMDDFAAALQNCDIPILVDIYAAREKSDGVTSSEQLAAKIRGAIYAGTLEKAAEIALQKAEPGDIIITMGAGNVVNACEYLLN